jgi:hypothetical protein
MSSLCAKRSVNLTSNWVTSCIHSKHDFTGDKNFVIGMSDTGNELSTRINLSIKYNYIDPDGIDTIWMAISTISSWNFAKQ